MGILRASGTPGMDLTIEQFLPWWMVYKLPGVPSLVKELDNPGTYSVSRVKSIMSGKKSEIDWSTAKDYKDDINADFFSCELGYDAWIPGDGSLAGYASTTASPTLHYSSNLYNGKDDKTATRHTESIDTTLLAHPWVTEAGLSQPTSTEEPGATDNLADLANISGPFANQTVGSGTLAVDHNVEYDPPTRFQCPTCPKAFTKRADLARHQRSLHSDKRLTCSECNGRFSRNDNLTVHLRNVHGVEIPKRGKK